MSDRDPLLEDLRDLLDAERELEAPAADTRQRLLTRLAPLLLVPPGGVPGATDAAGSATAGATKTMAGVGWRAKVLVPALWTALGAAGGAATQGYLARAPAAPPAHEIELPAAPSPALATSASASASTTNAPDATQRPESSGALPASPPAPASPGSLRAERLLLESATAALLRGDGTTALGTLQKHARLYPHGALAEEREVLWVKALRAQGNGAAAERRANDFNRKFPSSVQRGTVDEPGGTR